MLEERKYRNIIRENEFLPTFDTNLINQTLSTGELTDEENL